MEKTEQKKNPNEAMDIEGFPDYDDEYESVKQINERMMEARDNWNPPEKPSYEEESDGKDVYYTGTVRSIEQENVREEDYDQIKLGIDTGGEKLEWVEVKDTGEKTMKNPYVRFCDMYNANPETVQDLYGADIYVESRWDSPVIKPSQPIIKQLWTLQHIQHKLGFYEYKEKTMHWEGLVPRFRHLATYVATFFALGFIVADIPLLIPIFLVVSAILIWGSYAKARYDVLPYLGRMILHYWKVYNHKKV